MQSDWLSKQLVYTVTICLQRLNMVMTMTKDNLISSCFENCKTTLYQDPYIHKIQETVMLSNLEVTKLTLTTTLLLPECLHLSLLPGTKLAICRVQHLVQMTSKMLTQGWELSQDTVLVKNGTNKIRKWHKVYFYNCDIKFITWKQ
jgi:hypothetical protein